MLGQRDARGNGVPGRAVVSGISACVHFSSYSSSTIGHQQENQTYYSVTFSSSSRLRPTLVSGKC